MKSRTAPELGTLKLVSLVAGSRQSRSGVTWQKESASARRAA
jgi:hypothetical protein